MPVLDSKTLARHTEAERLIDLAKGMLNNPAEEIVTIYLDHAIDSLHALIEEEACPLAQGASSQLEGRAQAADHLVADVKADDQRRAQAGN